MMMRISNAILKLIFGLAFFLLNSQIVLAQFSFADLGVNGLTCSQCSRSVEMNLLKLDFVHEVKMNLENTAGRIVFKKNVDVELSKIAKAVTDAGFSVGFLKISYVFHDLVVSGILSLTGARGQFCFVNTNGNALKGEIQLTVLNKEFMPKDDFKKWNETIQSRCNKKKRELYYVSTTE